jgi:predicted permease
VNLPRWVCALLRSVAPAGHAEDAIGDLEETHLRRVKQRGRLIAGLLTRIDALDMALAFLRQPKRPFTGGGRSFTGMSWLDFKLGFRMLVRYPGLTLVGGLAIAFAIWVGAGTFEFLSQVVYPTLPLDGGERIVALQTWDAAANRQERRLLRDFALWREELKSVVDLGAYRTLERNLITGEGRGEPVELAEISASAFRLTRVAPLLGRPIVEADEQTGAPHVVVIGYELWQRRFGGDAGIVGRTLRLGSSPGTVVGVMPEGYAFPISHQLWVPLRLNALEFEPRQGPAIQIFGRLASGVSLAEAQAELSAVGARAAVDLRDTHQHLRPKVMPYAKSYLNIPAGYSAGLMASNVFLVMLLLLVCANVALLMFARAATRESEIVVRNALGASRSRIITQLFAEALVLGGIGAIIGLAAAGFGLRWLLHVMEAEVLDGGRLPFWFSDHLSPSTLLYACVLTLIGAVIAGVVPALKVTRGLSTQLRQATAGGGGFRFGGIWTAVIIAQVAVTVTFPVVAFFLRRDAVQIETLDVGFPQEEYLSVRLEMDAPDDSLQAALRARFGAAYRELERQMMAEPAVVGVTFADVLPQMYHGWNQIEVDEGALPPPDVRGHRVSAASIDLDYFDVLDTSVLSGRAFHSGDLASDARVVIVNQHFVERVLGGKNPIGRRLRYVAGESGREEGIWHEIVGVVRNIGMTSGYGQSGIYHPLETGNTHPVYMAVHVNADPLSLVPSLRGAATAVDPTLRLHDIMALDHIIDATLQYYAFWFRLTLAVSAIALLLALAGIYAVMSFTVSKRTREIGIRVALGADRRRIALAIFWRPLVQVGLGIVAGGMLTAAFSFGVLGASLWPNGALMVVAYSGLMMGVCMLACIVPTRRALSVEPIDALRADG